MATIEYPQNDFTRMIETVSRANAAGAARTLPIATGEAPPTVQSQAMRTPPPVEEEPLSAAELMELDRLAREAGMVDPRLGNANSPPDGGAGGDASQAQYENMTMEQVIAMSQGPRAAAPAAVPSAVPLMTRQNRHGQHSQQAIAQATPAPVVIHQPRLPNFKNVQGIDLITGDVFVDDMAFKISALDLSEFRRYAVEVARASIMRQLDEALSLVSQDGTEEGVDQEGETSEAEGVQRVGEGDSTQPTG